MADYNTNPFVYNPVSSSEGRDIFGTRIPRVGLPNPAKDIRKVTPGYKDLIRSITDNIMGNLSGEMSPAFQNAVTDSLNARGVSLGVGGSPFSDYGISLGLGRETLARQDLGAQQLMNFLGTQKQTATLDPALRNQIGQFNATNRAAPDPTALNNYWASLFSSINGAGAGAGGVGGGGSMGGGGAVGGGMPSWTSWTSPINPPVTGSPTASYSGGGNPWQYGTGPATAPPVNNTGVYTAPGGWSTSRPMTNLPDNWMSLSPSDQGDYVDSWIANAGIDPSLYE
jgi:hypothetical protein